MIFEEVESQLYFELILSPTDLERFEEISGIIGEYTINYQGIKTLNVFVRKEDFMPLKKGKSEKVFKENIRAEKQAHPSMPIKQAVAIAYSQKRKSGKNK